MSENMCNLVIKMAARAMMPVDEGIKLLDNILGNRPSVFIQEFEDAEKCPFELEKIDVNFDFWNEVEGMIIANQSPSYYMNKNWFSNGVVVTGDYLVSVEGNDVFLYRITVR